MTRVASPSWLFAALLLTAVGCGSSDSKSTDSSTAKACDDQVGEDCDCEDGSPSQYVCTAKELTCDCEDPPPPTTTTTKADAGKKPTSGTTGTGTTTKPDAKVPTSTGTTTKSDAGTSTTSTGGGGDAGGGSTTPAMPVGGPDPVLPDIKGDCPEFTTGTATIGGLSGISVQAGAKGTGTGALVFYWHGTGSSSFEAGQFAGASEVVSGGGIVIAPSGSTGMGMDCSGTGTFYQSDFDVADLIVACAVKNHGIDPHRIYTTGCSAGGLQAGCMGALRSSYIAAVLPNSGGEVFPLQFQDKTHIPALMTMHGGSSDMVIVTFSETSKSADMAYSAAGGMVINCDHGMGHCGAPGDLQAAGWQFMKDHPFGIKTDPYASGLPASFPKYCMPFK